MEKYQLKTGNWFYHEIYERYQKITSSDIHNYSQYLKPIELNNMWLFDLFEFKEHTNFNLIPKKSYFFKNGFVINKKYQPLKADFSDYLLDYWIDYVHELQELYYIIKNDILDKNDYLFIDFNQNIIQQNDKIKKRDLHNNLEQV